MFIPNIKASESLFSYLYRFSKLNHLLTRTAFHKSILLKNGNFVGHEKAIESLNGFIGESHNLLFKEIAKRARSAPFSHRVYIRGDPSSDIDRLDENLDKSMRYCPDCIAEQHYLYGHAWLKRDWLFHFGCSIHKKQLSKLEDTARELGASYFDAFEYVLNNSSISCGEVFPKQIANFENRPCTISPCLLIDYFKSTAKGGKFDFHEYEDFLSNIISLLYQYLNCFPNDEKARFADYLYNHAESWAEGGMYFYKSSASCVDCVYKSHCSGLQVDSSYRKLDESDVKSVLSWVFQRSELPLHVSEKSILAYTKMRAHLLDFYEPNTFESDTIEWLTVLMSSTFGAHTELVSRGDEGITFENIQREPISGLLVFRLKRERIDSLSRVVILPRFFEDKIQWYVNQRYAGKLHLTAPILSSRTGGKALLAAELSRIVRKPFQQIDYIPEEGRTLHSIRNLVVASAIDSGGNSHYVVKACGLRFSPLNKLSVLPI
ncbi:TniQ family protein [Vibrio splendidus]